MAKSHNEIWNDLNSTDVTQHVESNSTAGTSYLPWVAMHKILMSKFAGDYTWQFERDEHYSELFSYPDGTAEVRCVTTIHGHSVSVSQVVTQAPSEASDDYEPAINPNARQIHNAKMRARVRCAAEGFGLGFNLWSQKTHISPEADQKTQDKTKKQFSTKDLFDASVGKESTLNKATDRYNKLLSYIDQTGDGNKIEAAQLFDELTLNKGWVLPTTNKPRGTDNES